MYVPAWQGISPLLLWRRGNRCLPPYPLDRPGSRYFYVARSAIYHAARALSPRPGDVALAPAYHNGLEVRALRAAGASIRFYRVNAALEPNLDDIGRALGEGARLALVIHYNGWPQPIESIAALCRAHGAALIEDCALAFLSERGGKPLGSIGDASVFCLYKTLPIPNGAVLAQNGIEHPEIAGLTLRTPGWVSTAARSSELVVAWIRGRAERLGGTLAAAKRGAGSLLSSAHVARLPVGNMEFDLGLMDVAMSPWARRLLPRFDYEAIRARRRANFERLLALLGDAATPLLTSLPEGVCPLFFPLLVPDKKAAAAALQTRGIESVEFWNRGDPEAEGAPFEDAMFLRRHVLELPIHQDLTPEQVDYMAGAVLALGLRMERA